MSNELYDKFKIIEEYGLDLEGRVIYFSDEIDMDTVTSIACQIQFLSHHSLGKNDPIYLVISSPGGDLDAMFYLYDIIINSKNDIVTIGIGSVASAATLILLCGDRRYVTEHCQVMTHKGSAILEGDEDEVESQRESFARCTDKYWKLLERHSNRKAHIWLKRSKRQGELWMPPKELLKCKAIDGILKSERRSFPPLVTKRVQDIIAEMEKLQDAVEDQEEENED